MDAVFRAGPMDARVPPPEDLEGPYDERRRSAGGRLLPWGVRESSRVGSCHKVDVVVEVVGRLASGDDEARLLDEDGRCETMSPDASSPSRRRCSASRR